MPQFKWNPVAEDDARELVLNIDDIEMALKQRIDSQACEPYGARGRLGA